LVKLKFQRVILPTVIIKAFVNRSPFLNNACQLHTPDIRLTHISTFERLFLEL
jgi:hypothetical protein